MRCRKVSWSVVFLPVCWPEDRLRNSGFRPPTADFRPLILGSCDQKSDIHANSCLCFGKRRLNFRPYMAQGLQLSQRLTQSLVLAPQLQQSLALLQAPTLELKALVEQELQQNPVLEEAAAPETELHDSDKDGESIAEKADPAEPPADVTFDPATEKASNEPVDDFQAEFERLVQLDQEWRDHFSQTNIPLRASAEDEEKRQFMFDSLVAGTSLQEMLLEQVRESALPEDQWPVAEMLIGNIDDYGYLKTTIE